MSQHSLLARFLGSGVVLILELSELEGLTVQDLFSTWLHFRKVSTRRRNAKRVAQGHTASPRDSFFWDPVPFSILLVFCPGKLCSQAQQLQKAPRALFSKEKWSGSIFKAGPALLPRASCPGKAGFTVPFATHGKQQMPEIDDTQAQEWKKLVHDFKCLFQKKPEIVSGLWGTAGGEGVGKQGAGTRIQPRSPGPSSQTEALALFPCGT